METSLKEDIRSLGFELRAEMAALRAEIKGDIAELRTELKGDIARLEIKIAESKSAMIAWMFVFWIGQVATMKFFR